MISKLCSFICSAIVLCAFFSTAAIAELSISDRMADCFNVRMPAVARGTWQAASCQKDNSCSPFQPEVYGELAAARCVDEAALICAAKEGRSQKRCFQESLGILQAKAAEFDLDALRASLKNLVEKSTGFRRSSLVRSLEDLDDLSIEKCPEVQSLTYPFEALDGQEFCVWFRQTRELSRLTAIQGLVTRSTNE